MKFIFAFCIALASLSAHAADYEIYVVKADKTQDMSQYISKNMTRGGHDTKSFTCSDALSLSVGDKSIIVTSDQFGPLPVTLTVQDKQGHILYEKENADDYVSAFTVPIKILGGNNKIYAHNAFGDELMCNNVKTMP